MNTGVMKPSYWLCDACGRVLFHGEYRFNCTVCYNYDYCEQCAAPPNSPHPHRMVRELAYGSRQRHECDDRVDMATNIQTAIYMYFDRHCMGIRDIDKDDPSIFLESYQWTTFETIGNRAKNFGHGLRQITNPRDYLAICAANRPEWVITDFACIFQSIISVPIYTSFTDHEIAYIINNTKITVIVCDKQLLPRLVGIKSQCPSMKHIICMDPVPDTITSESIG